MGLFTKYIAQFWDEQGKPAGNTSFKRFKKTFKFKNGTYNVKTKEGSWYKRKNQAFGLVDKIYYQYSLDCPDPILMDKKREPVINPEDYNTILETNHLKKLNDAYKEGILANLNFKTILVIGAVILGAYLLITGGLTP